MSHLLEPMTLMQLERTTSPRTRIITVRRSSGLERKNSRLNLVAVTRQLNDGIRLLQSQVHNNSGVIQLCHTSCALYNGGPLSDYLIQGETLFGRDFCSSWINVPC